jgi:hypothetical protein
MMKKGLGLILNLHRRHKSALQTEKTGAKALYSGRGRMAAFIEQACGESCQDGGIPFRNRIKMQHEARYRFTWGWEIIV